MDRQQPSNVDFGTSPLSLQHVRPPAKRANRMAGKPPPAGDRGFWQCLPQNDVTPHCVYPVFLHPLSLVSLHLTCFGLCQPAANPMQRDEKCFVAIYLLTVQSTFQLILLIFGRLVKWCTKGRVLLFLYRLTILSKVQYIVVVLSFPNFCV